MRPNPALYVILSCAILTLLLFAWFSWVATSLGLSLAALAFLALFGAGTAWYSWFACIRQVYWSPKGVGTRRSPWPKFIAWEAVTDARNSAGDLIVVSKTVRLAYLPDLIGAKELTAEVVRRFPHFTKNFRPKDYATKASKRSGISIG